MIKTLFFISGNSSWLPRATATNYHKLGCLNSRRSSSHRSGGQKSEIMKSVSQQGCAVSEGWRGGLFRPLLASGSPVAVAAYRAPTSASHGYILSVPGHPYLFLLLLERQVIGFRTHPQARKISISRSLTKCINEDPISI